MPLSKQTTTPRGRSSANSLISIAVKPYTALVTCPEDVTRVSGNAKNARNANE